MTARHAIRRHSPDEPSQKRRVLKLLYHLLHNEHATYQSLGREFGVHQGTIRRYLDDIEAAGFHLETDERGKYRQPFQLKEKWQVRRRL